MLFTAERGANQTPMADDSFRVKRVCMDPMLIETFCAEGPYYTPVKTMSQAIDLDSDDPSDDAETVEDSQGLDFLKSTCWWSKIC
ncbi:hypothetical protein A2U01_0001457 [Trifolium medium]|uniref:Uncharacterized protein n=1 Tax=Trifolium medium TaxID=97028 RepID=A0A392M0C7_9FABA|nr:hypothetical protein [Trifolium medium]